MTVSSMLIAINIENLRCRHHFRVAAKAAPKIVGERSGVRRTAAKISPLSAVSTFRIAQRLGSGALSLGVRNVSISGGTWDRGYGGASRRIASHRNNEKQQAASGKIYESEKGSNKAAAKLAGGIVRSGGISMASASAIISPLLME